MSEEAVELELDVPERIWLGENNYVCTRSGCTSTHLAEYVRVPQFGSPVADQAKCVGCGHSELRPDGRCGHRYLAAESSICGHKCEFLAPSVDEAKPESGSEWNKAVEAAAEVASRDDYKHDSGYRCGRGPVIADKILLLKNEDITLERPPSGIVKTEGGRGQ